MSFTSLSSTPPERRLKKLLNILVLAFSLATLAYALGPLVGPFKDFFKQLPFVSNSAVKTALLALCALYAAGDLRRRMGLVEILIAAHAVSILAMLVFLAFADTGRIVDLGPITATAGQVLIGAIVLDALITALLVVLYLPARRATAAARGRVRVIVSGDLTGIERWLLRLLIVLGAAFVVAAILYELGPLLAATREFSVELPFVSNSVVKVATLAMLSFYAARDLRRNMPLVGVLITGHVISGLALLVFLLLVNTGFEVEIAGRNLVMSDLLWGALVLDGGIAAVLLLVYLAAWRARWRLKFLMPMEYRALITLADVLVHGREEKVPAEDIAANVDTYVDRIRARRRWVYRGSLFAIQLHPLLYGKAPFSELDAESRLHHLKTHFEKFRPRANPFERLVQAAMRVTKQLTYVGYYNDPRSFESVGYVPFSRRPRYAELPIPPPAPHPLIVQRPADVGSAELETDVCIVGSGAGGAILAYNLARAGREVLVLERGQYVEPREFSENEVEMIGRLYADGVFQQTTDYRFTVLQGSCVGGSTTVNNAVCFPPPERVLARWNDATLHDAGLDLDALAYSVREVVDFLPVTPQSDVRLNPSWPKYVQGAVNLGLVPEQLEVDVVRANLKGCFGCGYCNIGCRFGKKLSMLDTALPWAQRDFPGRVRILAECEVEWIRALSGASRRVSDLRAKLGDGRKITIRAKTFVLSAGAIGSSYLLLRSGIGHGLPVGRGLCFNMGAAVTAEFDEAMDAYDGLQISHYGIPRTGNGFVFETWWNPPAAQAVNMPGWFGDHFQNMRSYRRLMAAGVLVGTAGNGRVRQALTGGADIEYEPRKDDLRKLGEGLKLLGRILFAAGARRVMLNTWSYDVLADPSQLSRIDDIVLARTLALGSGHPQGGNAISRDPKRGVVDPEFKVHGTSNLYVCDASVFPSSLTVNPQLTVMALAHYAAPRIR